MMQSLIGIISAVESDIVDSKTELRFKDKSQFRTPEALIIREQNLLEEDRLHDACEREYNTLLATPNIRYVSPEIVNKFANKNVVVLDYDVANSIIYVGTIPEFFNEAKKIVIDGFNIHLDKITIYTYVETYTKQFGEPDFLAELPIRDKLDFIYNEALTLKASDITITNTMKGAEVYYNIRKKKVHSQRRLGYDDVDPIARLIASSGNATLAEDTAQPRYVSININKQNRGRVVINKTYYGLLVTIRILPNTVLTNKLEDWNVSPNTCEFIRETMLSPEKGLRLFIGETMSGKNTTILSALHELVLKDAYKIVSLEQPVEILVDGIEQINAETDAEFELNADSLLRQNPDIVYFTEITARTAKSIMQQSNTAKAVFSTIHANSIAEVLFRLEDITHLPLDRIILTLHSCVYQELVRDEKTDTVYPYNKCVYFSEDLKMQLYGKPIAEIIGVLRGEENRWVN